MQDSRNKRSNNAYILENTVFHARHLPISSKHAFTYPTLALLLRLSALESRDLDLCAGRLFRYSPAGSPAPWARVMGVRPETYLHDPNSYLEGSVKGKSVREKLAEVLMRFQVDPREMEDVWMLTMPRYLGAEGINPLTVYYCYKKMRRDAGGELALWVVVLEFHDEQVHNTFGERHVYVLRTGSEHEDKQAVPAVITAFLMLTYLEKVLFLALGARFVRGTEPWGMWERVEGVWKARREAKEGRETEDLT
ncbi:hypothetical protein A7U60_g6920 [Sanghuangporus baumii]|uniref:Uncharacterized protein n=1 Tax=Sanghuangporus baumii TaxID=108892 RepID=A0A9Q5HU38_SANBA|nr:hypothetical protein A7U60_g6920 [Sanghuangporus baumii]